MTDVKSIFGSRIKERRELLGLSQDALAKMVGYSSRSSINKIELGLRNVSQTKCAKLAKALNTTTSYLLGDVDDPSIKISPPGSLLIPDLSRLYKVPVLGHSACGQPIEAIREYDYVEVDKALSADFALIAEGDSMTGCGIMNGSMVLFKNVSEVNNGDIAAVTIDNATTIKRFYRYGNVVVLKACNPLFEDQEYSDDELENLHVFGKCVACFTGY